MSKCQVAAHGETGNTGNLAVGKQGEDLAAAFLRARGYQIYFRNFRCRYGELDIIAKKGRVLSIVEVKTRGSNQYGMPCESVDTAKQKHLVQAGAYFIQRFSLQNMEVRFDVIEIQINHLRDE